MPQNTRTPRVGSILASYAASLAHCESETTCLRATVPATTLCTTHIPLPLAMCVFVCGSRSTDIQRFSATAHSAHSFAAHPFWRWFAVSPAMDAQNGGKSQPRKGFCVLCGTIYCLVCCIEREREEGRKAMLFLIWSSVGMLHRKKEK